MPATRISGTRFLDPAVLARIGNLQLLAKSVVEGFISGLHRSPYLGRSMDFAEYRAYLPGDDIRQIDWKLFSRTDRHYVKQYEGDTNTDLVIALDVSRSMDFGTAAMTKLEYAKCLAACLALFGSRQRDRVGLATFDRDVVDWVPAAAKHLPAVLRTLDRAEAGEAGSLHQPLLRIADRCRRRGFTVVLSDLYEPPEEVMRAAGLLRVRGNDVILFHVLDPAETELPYDAPLDLEDAESGGRLSVQPDALREQYHELVRAHIAELEKRSAQMDIDYCRVDTGAPLDDALYRFLSARLWAQKSR